MTSCDVLVVGAGPVGMSLALQLAGRGVDVIGAERNPSTSDEPKAISLERRGAAGVPERRGRPPCARGARARHRHPVLRRGRRPLFHARAAVPLRYGYPFKNPFAQPDLERVLREAMSVFPDRIRAFFGAEVIDLVDDDDAVLAAVRGASSGTVRARFVVGADGGRSPVRELRGIGMVGRSHDEPWLVVDTVGDDRDERYAMHHGDPRRPHVIVPGLEGRCRYEFRLFPGEGEPGAAPDFELIRALVAPYRRLSPEHVERAVIYRFHGLVATHWRCGRVFLAGDAAHMMPPFAGQGLNSGLRDAANLSWKLAAVLSGELGAQALDSYQAERGPHAEATVRLSQRLGRIVMTTNSRVAAHRDRAVRAALATEEGRRFLEEMRFRPTARYERGLVVPSHELVGTMIGQPRVFSTAGHRITLLDEVLGTGWSVLGVHAPATAWPAARGVVEGLPHRLVSIPFEDRMLATGPGVETAIDVDGRLAAELGPARGHLTLLRPDRFVAAVWEPGDEDRVRRAVEGWRSAPGRAHTTSRTALPA